MVEGRLQIQRISAPGEKPETFQVTHEEYEGGEFVGSVQGDRLGAFLHETLRMDADFVERLLDELYLHGHAIVPDVRLPEAELAAAGLKHLPDDGEQ